MSTGRGQPVGMAQLMRCAPERLVSCVYCQRITTAAEAMARRVRAGRCGECNGPLRKHRFDDDRAELDLLRQERADLIAWLKATVADIEPRIPADFKPQLSDQQRAERTQACLWTLRGVLEKLEPEA